MEPELSDRLMRYSRQIILPQVGEKGQELLLKSTVTVVGCGALGCAAASLLARGGVGRIRIIDRDVVERDNLQRQILFTEKDIGEPKALVAQDGLSEINSEIEIKGIVKDMNFATAESLMEGSDVVIDGLDNMETRFLINDVCVKNSIPWIHGGAVSSYGMCMNVLPDGHCFTCVFPTLPSPGSLPTCDTAGVLNTIPLLISSIECTEAYKIIINDTDNPPSRNLVMFDVWNRDFQVIEVARDSACRTCAEKKFEFLNAEKKDLVTALCGRESVQITPIKRGDISLKDLAERLSRLGSVKISRGVLIFNLSSYQLTVFEDGRTLVKGTTDENTAKSLYSKYVGD